MAAAAQSRHTPRNAHQYSIYTQSLQSLPQHSPGSGSSGGFEKSCFSSSALSSCGRPPAPSAVGFVGPLLDEEHGRRGGRHARTDNGKCGRGGGRRQGQLRGAMLSIWVMADFEIDRLVRVFIVATARSVVVTCLHTCICEGAAAPVAPRLGEPSSSLFELAAHSRLHHSAAGCWRTTHASSQSSVVMVWIDQPIKRGGRNTQNRRRRLDLASGQCQPRPTKLDG